MNKLKYIYALFVICAALSGCASIAPKEAFCPWGRDTKTGYIDILKMKDNGFGIVSYNWWVTYEIINAKGVAHESYLSSPVEAEKVEDQLQWIVHERTQLPAGDYKLRIGTINTQVSVHEGEVNVYWLESEQASNSITLFNLGTIASPEKDITKMKHDLSEFIYSGNTGKMCIAVIYLGYYGGTDSIDELKYVKTMHGKFSRIVNAAIKNIELREKKNKKSS